MEKLSSASALIDKSRPERPVRGLRPHAAGRAARWFLEKFPGDVAYAYKANSSVFLIGALYGAGIRHFDVASLPEIEDAATIPDAHLHFMHPVKSRHAIRRAYELGVRSFSLDGEDELDKIIEATGGARDLLLWVRVAVPAINSRIPLERKFGVARREGRAASGQDAPGRRRAGPHLPRRLADDDARRLRHGAGRGASHHRQVGRHDRPPRHRRRLSLALSRQRSGAAAGFHGRDPREHRDDAGEGEHQADVRARPRARCRGREPDRARRCAARQQPLHQRRLVRHAVRRRASRLHLPDAHRRPRGRRRGAARAVRVLGADLRFASTT